MGYILVGIIWCWWLEYYTTTHIKGIFGRKWVWRERIFHSLLWPISLSIFCYNFFKELW